MPTILLRIFLVSNLLNTVLLYLIPKKLRTFLPHSWYPQVQQPPTGNLLHTTKTAAPPPPPTAARIQKMMDADDLRPVFQIFDRNGDGRITKEELSDSLGNMGIFITDQEMTRMIEKVDANGDGCVDIDEFGVLYQSVMDDRGGEEAAAEGEEEEEMREAFVVFDQDGDGFITREELRSVLAALGLREGSAAAECGRMIAKVDVDGDGKVSFNEFKQMLMRGSGFAALS